MLKLKKYDYDLLHEIAEYLKISDSEDLKVIRAMIGKQELLLAAIWNMNIFWNFGRWSKLQDFQLPNGSWCAPLYFLEENYHGKKVFSNATNGTVFRCQEKGDYWFWAYIEMVFTSQLTTLSAVELGLFKNGSFHSKLAKHRAGANFDVSQTGCVLSGGDGVVLSCGDTVDLRIQGTGDTTQLFTSRKGYFGFTRVPSGSTIITQPT